MGKNNVAHSKRDVHNEAHQAPNNFTGRKLLEPEGCVLIDFYTARSTYALIFPNTDWGRYQRALYKQTKARRDEEQRLRLGLSKEAWAKELDRRLDFERPYPRPF